MNKDRKTMVSSAIGGICGGTFCWLTYNGKYFPAYFLLVTWGGVAGGYLLGNTVFGA